VICCPTSPLKDDAETVLLSDPLGCVEAGCEAEVAGDDGAEHLVAAAVERDYRQGLGFAEAALGEARGELSSCGCGGIQSVECGDESSGEDAFEVHWVSAAVLAALGDEADLGVSPFGELS
jgi:hypothetical protein